MAHNLHHPVDGLEAAAPAAHLTPFRIVLLQQGECQAVEKC